MVRPATTGDHFLIAIPVGEDLERLKAYQTDLAAAVGGEVEEDIHLTLQRFEIPAGKDVGKVIDAIQSAIGAGPAPDVIATTLVVTFHSYFKKHSVRWLIEATPDLGRLTLQSAQSIMHQGGKSHWPNAEASISQFMTAVWMEQEANVPESYLQAYPHRLMSVSHLEVTHLVADHKFETLKVIEVGG